MILEKQVAMYASQHVHHSSFIRQRATFLETSILSSIIVWISIFSVVGMANRLCHERPFNPKGHPLHDKKNAKVIGKFKDETNGFPPLEFVGLRSKMYSLLLPDDKEMKTAKGVKRSFVAKSIRHANYRDCLEKESTTLADFNNIRSIGHTVHSTNIVKAALSPYDDKRYLLTSKSSLSYGHYKIALKTEDSDEL